MKNSLFTISMVLLNGAIFGCGSNVTVRPFGEFRHTLLVPRSMEREDPVRHSFHLSPPSETLEVRCQSDFRHPVLNRCESWPGGGKTSPPESRKVVMIEKSMADPDRGRALVVGEARSLLVVKNERYRAGGKVIRRDCAGLVMAAYAAAGVPLDAYLPADSRKGESLVARLYRGLAQRGRIHTHKVPEIGDLVFFDNTFDRNRDGRANDLLTHVGIVESVKADGTVIVIHHARGGALRSRLNLFHPELRRDPKTGQALNHYLRFADGQKKKRLAGELFAGFATVIH